MKIKDGCYVHTDDFWYDLTCGGYIDPAEILENQEDISEVVSAINTLMEFQASIDEYMEGNDDE